MVILRSVIEVLGLGCLIAAAFLIDLVSGLAALGIGLILAANYAGRSAR